MKCYLLVCLLGVALASEMVIPMSYKESKSEVSEADLLLFNFLMVKPHYDKRPSRLGKYQFNNCGDPNKEVVVISQLTITPDPIPSTGTLNITFKGQVKKQIASPLKASVTVKKEAFGIWVKVPCVENIGSCDYSDFCEILAKINPCPAPFIKYKVPCHCPFPPANYTLPGVGISVNLSELPKGGYSVRVNLNTATDFVGCYEVEFTLE